MARRKNKNVDNRAYKFRLLPNAEQTILINKTFAAFGLCITTSWPIEMLIIKLRVEL